MDFEITVAASAADIAEVERLDNELDREMIRFLPSFFDPGQITRNYEGIADGTRGFALVARAGGEAVGMARVMCGTVAMLDSLIVCEGYRGLGMGTALLNRAREMAKARGLKIMMLNVLRGNDGAKRLYDDAGFSEFRTSMVCEL